MKNIRSIILVVLLVLVSSCGKNNNENLEPCIVSNQGIFFQSNAGNNYCTIDSVILSNQKFSIWFSDNLSGQSYRSELFRHDGAVFKSGTYYFVTNPNDNNPAFNYPAINFTVEELMGTQTANSIFLFDKFPVCIQMEDSQSEMGVLIEGMKVYNSSFGHNFLTFSLEDQTFLAK